MSWLFCRKQLGLLLFLTSEVFNFNLVVERVQS